MAERVKQGSNTSCGSTGWQYFTSEPDEIPSAVVDQALRAGATDAARMTPFWGGEVEGRQTEI